MRVILLIFTLLLFCNCNSKSKSVENLSKEVNGTDTIKLNWGQRPKLELQITDINGKKKDIIKGDTLIVKVSMTNTLKEFRSNSKVIVDQKMNQNCRSEQINDSTFKILVSKTPKGSLMTFELMLYRPKTVFLLPNNGSNSVENIIFKDSLGISAFAFEIK